MNIRWAFPNIFIQRHLIFYGEVANLLLTYYRLVAYVANLLQTSYGEVANLLRTCYRLVVYVADLLAAQR